MLTTVHSHPPKDNSEPGETLIKFCINTFAGHNSKTITQWKATVFHMGLDTKLATLILHADSEDLVCNWFEHGFAFVELQVVVVAPCHKQSIRLSICKKTEVSATSLAHTGIQPQDKHFKFHVISCQTFASFLCHL